MPQRLSASNKVNHEEDPDDGSSRRARLRAQMASRLVNACRMCARRVGKGEDGERGETVRVGTIGVWYDRWDRIVAWDFES